MSAQEPLEVFEFDLLSDEDGGSARLVPTSVFAWLLGECARQNEEEDGPKWLRLRLNRGRPAVQVTNYVGVIRSPQGFQIEVLPKVGRADESAGGARKILIQMLACLGEFRHLRTASAELAAEKMPLLEVFIAEFLEAVRRCVQRGIRSGYEPNRGNLYALRGKLLVADNIKRNLVRPDRFYTEYDEFTLNRPENRILRKAMDMVKGITRNAENQRLARELDFIFIDIPSSIDPFRDFATIVRQRGMDHYTEPLTWARLIITGLSPVTGSGTNSSPSLLYPMETLFEAFVAKHLRRHLAPGFVLASQNGSKHLVRQGKRKMFRLKPDLLISEQSDVRLVLDTKWKLLDQASNGAREKYLLSQGDLYQLHAYGHNFLGNRGDLILIYPRTAAFSEALEAFEYNSSPQHRLWVVPFCLSERRLLLPDVATGGGEVRRAFVKMASSLHE
jgi:5-methylcytosine-specific restriction enzyme subunit McrC